MRGRNGNAGEIAILYELSGRATPNLGSLGAMAAAHGHRFDGIRSLVDQYDDAWPWLDRWIAEQAPAFSFMAAVMRYTVDCDAVVIGGRIPRPLASRVVAAMRWPEQIAPARRNRPAAAPRLLVAALSADHSAMLGAATLPFMQRLFA